MTDHRGHRLLPLLIVLLVCVGLLCLAGGARTEPDYRDLLLRQALWAAAGITAAIVLSRIDYAVWHRLAFPLYGAALLALLVTLLGGETIRGSRSWLDLGWFNLQTSEFAKLALALALAAVVSRRTAGEWSSAYDREAVTRLFAATALTLPPLLLIILQSDLGTALTLLPPLLLALLIGGIPPGMIALFLAVSGGTVGLLLVLLTARWLPATHHAGVLFARLVTDRDALAQVLLAACFALLALAYLLHAFFPLHAAASRAPRSRRLVWGGYLLLVIFVLALELSTFAMAQLKPYQQLRLIAFLDPQAQPLHGGYNLLQAQIAIGSGGLFGKGVGNGTQHRLGFLPEAHTDFIFAIWAEEQGLAGVLLLVLLYAGVARCCWRIVCEARDRFSAAFTFIFSGGLLLQALYNLGMNLGLLPIMGIPLPLVSYGGSSLVSVLLGCGIVLAIWRYRLTFGGIR